MAMARTASAFQPTANYFGSSSMSFKGWDTVDGKADGSTGADTSAGGGNNPYSSATETAAINVLAVDDPPAPVNDSYIATEDATLSVPAGGVLTNDVDIDGPFPLTAVVVSGPAHGTLTLNTDGSFAYKADANYNGPDSFTYKAIDGDGEYGVAVASLTVNPVNDNPTAANVAFVLPEDGGPTPLDVLANDSSFPDSGETLTVAGIATAAAHGTVVVTAGGGSVTYTSDKDYNGPDSFSYTIADSNGGVATASVNITVTSVNDPPIARNDVAGLMEDAGPQTILVLANDDSGPDTGETLLVHDVTQGLHGTVTIAADKKSILYNPNPNFAGPDQFLYTIDDGNGGTASAAVSVDVANDHADRLEVVTTTATECFTEAVPEPGGADPRRCGRANRHRPGRGPYRGDREVRVRLRGQEGQADLQQIHHGGRDVHQGQVRSSEGRAHAFGVGQPGRLSGGFANGAVRQREPRTGRWKSPPVTIQVKDSAGIGDPGYKLIKVVRRRIRRRLCRCRRRWRPRNSSSASRP